jgi:energy-coupling factor transporter ATP-binding protein EcfA2
MINLEQVSFGYNSAGRVLSGVSLNVAAGEKVCLLGLNGSGKSTLLKLIAGILHAQNGRIMVNDLLVGEKATESEMRSQLAFIFQNPQDQIVLTTVTAELAFTLENLGVPMQEIEARVGDTSKRFGLTELLTRHPMALSAGEQQRTALAGALITGPKIVVLDEPTSYLDHRGREFLLDTLFAEPELTILAATQYPSEARRYGRALLLDKGEIVFSGKPADLFESADWKRLTGDAPDIDHNSSSEISDTMTVSAHDVSFGYEERRFAVSDVDLVAHAGEITAIVGHSGCGKTTLGLLLAKLIEPSKGQIEHSGGKSRVGYLMQFPESQFFAEDVLTEVAFAISEMKLGKKEIAARVRTALEMVGLDYDLFKFRSPFTLSGGEQRRIAIASVLVMDPDVIIFDEPTVALDWRASRSLRALLYRLRRLGKTVIILSHDLDFVFSTAAHVILLEDGKTLWSGSLSGDDFPEPLFKERFGELPSILSQLREFAAQGKPRNEIEDRLLHL